MLFGKNKDTKAKASTTHRSGETAAIGKPNSSAPSTSGGNGFTRSLSGAAQRTRPCCAGP